MATTTKTLAPTGQTVTLPDMTERPNSSILVDGIGKDADAINALNTQMTKHLTMNGVGTSVTFQCTGAISSKQYAVLVIGVNDVVLAIIHSSNYSAISIKTGTAKACSMSGNNLTVSGFDYGRYYLIIPDTSIINDVVFGN
jgi:hypothetical protein